MSIVNRLSKYSSSNFRIPWLAYRNCDKRWFIPLPTTVDFQRANGYIPSWSNMGQNCTRGTFK